MLRIHGSSFPSIVCTRLCGRIRKLVDVYADRPQEADLVFIALAGALGNMICIPGSARAIEIQVNLAKPAIQSNALEEKALRFFKGILRKETA